MAKKRTSSSSTSASKPSKKSRPAKKKRPTRKKKAGLSRRAAARELQVTTRTLNDWQASDWWPDDGGNASDGYNIAAIEAARSAIGASDELDADDAAALRREKLQQEVREKTAKADRIEREEAVARGELVERAEVELQIAEWFTLFRDRIHGMSRRLAKHLPTKMRTDFIEEATRDAEHILREVEKAANAVLTNEDS